MFEGLIRKAPSPKTVDALARMTRDHGADLMCDALRMEAALGGTNDLLKRTGRRIREDAKKRHEEYEQARSRSEESATKLERPEGLTDDELLTRQEAIRAFAGGFTMKGEG
jgi:hypothetical protein